LNKTKGGKSFEKDCHHQKKFSAYNPTCKFMPKNISLGLLFVQFTLHRLSFLK